MSRPIRVLLVEDSEFDAALLLLELQARGYAPQCERVETAAAMDAALNQQAWDVVVADYVLPQFSGPDALRVLQKRNLDLPFIIVSGHIDEETAVASMKAGAHDYVMKDRLAGLVPAIEREIVEAASRTARRRSEEQYAQAQEDLRRAHAELEQRVRDRTADLQKANTSLQEAMRERRRLEHELLEITEKERRRIGLDLHDDLGQKLAGLSMMMKGLEVSLVKKKLPEAVEAEQIFALVQATMAHASGLARDLALVELDQDDLPLALTGLADHVKKLFNISCQFESKGAIPPLDRNTITQFYKIAQEAITNAVKHGKSRQVDIQLVSEPARLVLTIRNQGKPFPSMIDQKKGMGLRIMKYRASVIGATVEIKPARPSGAVVTCCLPSVREFEKTIAESRNAPKNKPR